MPSHTGSWGLPEYGVTEKIASLFGNNRTAQGGSNLTGSVGSYPTAIRGGNPIQGPGLGWSGDIYNRGALSQDTSRTFAPSGGGSAPAGSNTNNQGTVVQRDVNSYNPNNLSGWGQNFGSDRAAYEAYGAQVQAQQQQQDLSDQIDGIYSPQNDYLNQTEQYYRNQLPGYQTEAQGNYDVNKQLLGSSRDSATNTINNQETKGQRATEDALSRARRVFQEQQISGQQRFGGSSSAGGAYSELLARNLQSEQGQTQRQAVDYTQQISQMRQETQRKYDDSLMQLEQQKQTALTGIQREFDQKLLEIQGNRTQLESGKAQAKLQALMDLRNKTFAIQQQQTQFAQAVELQRQAAMQQTSQYGQQASATGQSALSAFGNYNTQVGNQEFGMNTSAPQTNTGADYSQYIGAIGKSINSKDKLGRNMYSDGTAGWTNYGYGK